VGRGRVHARRCEELEGCHQGHPWRAYASKHKDAIHDAVYEAIKETVGEAKSYTERRPYKQVATGNVQTARGLAKNDMCLTASPHYRPRREMIEAPQRKPGCKKRNWRPFEEARGVARGLGLSGSVAWKAYASSGNKPRDIPSNPALVYADEWCGYGDWLGTGRKMKRRWRTRASRNWRSFEKAREFARSLGLRNHKEWLRYAKSGDLPQDMPTDPRLFYKDEWRGVTDWLGTENRRFPKRGDWRPFGEARRFVRSLELRSEAECREYCKSGDKPLDIPTTPEKVYRAEWRGFRDWLGTSRYRTTLPRRTTQRLARKSLIRRVNKHIR
jgi:hypothetical protein